MNVMRKQDLELDRASWTIGQMIDRETRTLDGYEESFEYDEGKVAITYGQRSVEVRFSDPIHDRAWLRSIAKYLIHGHVPPVRPIADWFERVFGGVFSRA